MSRGVGESLAIALQGLVGTAGFLTYLLAHAFVKSSPFFVAGILLHRLRTSSEPALFGKATQLRGSAAMWFLGGIGLVGNARFRNRLRGIAHIECSGDNWGSLAVRYLYCQRVDDCRHCFSRRLRASNLDMAL